MIKYDKSDTIMFRKGGLGKRDIKLNAVGNKGMCFTKQDNK
jgi:hypothetical protein